MDSMKEVETLKQEVEFMEEVKKIKDRLTVSEKFKESTEALNKVLNLQIFPRDKTSLGYDKKHAIKGSSSITQEDVEDVKFQDDASKDTPT